MVVAGYAVLQPRVTATMPEAQRSPFSRLTAGNAGIDPYTRETSDLYHDLFGQGSFIGKGIYDVHAFESACEGRFPDNRLLSHDLIEGCFARSGLVNDVELFEGVPSRLLVDMNRRQRWIRGDWQIASWLGNRVPTLQGTGANPLSGLSRWKIFDNLRRSLAPALLGSFLVLGWLLAPALAGACTLAALALVFGPASLAALAGVLRRPEGKPWRLHAADEARQYLRTCLAEAVGWCILPYTVYCYLDAIVRTLYRLGVSRSHLLEWTTASAAEAGCRRSFAHTTKSWRPASCPASWWRLCCLRSSLRPCWSPARCCWPGSQDRGLPGGSRCLIPARLSRRRVRPSGSFAAGPGRPGITSRALWARPTTGCRPTTCKAIRRSPLPPGEGQGVRAIWPLSFPHHAYEHRFGAALGPDGL